MIFIIIMRYYGNKTKLLDFLSENISRLGLTSGASIFDAFSGTASVGKFFKKQGFRVISNDILYFSYILSKAQVTLNSEPKFKKVDTKVHVVDFLNEIDGVSGFITKNYSPFQGNVRQYFTIENAQKIDAIRAKIHAWKEECLIDEDEEAYLICSLLMAVSSISNISGTYGSYLKSWDKRAFKPLRLERLELFDNMENNVALNCDIVEVVNNYHCDILYLDPPYNSRQYASNYFLLELIAEGWFDSLPQIYGHTGMRPYTHQKSKFCTKKEAFYSIKEILDKNTSKYILLSYNNEGIIPVEDLLSLLQNYGSVDVESYTHKRYRSIKQDGSKPTTKEILFICKTK
ncbi:DNA adenine methylase [Acinetobacter baumannii]|uniref:DNA adenine methylase n=1 Tax=Acinetobacter baumannii TaxID=470 RepID=UPI002ADBCF9D|nr:DNA adenine methylase [Acinetobacter baumannii]